MKLFAYTGQAKIYRIEEDTMTEMEVEIEDGCFVFKTNHFSLYTLVGYQTVSTIGAFLGIAVALAGMTVIVWLIKKKKEVFVRRGF